MPTAGANPSNGGLPRPGGILGWIPGTPQWFGYQAGEAIVPGTQYEQPFDEGAPFDPLIEPLQETATQLGTTAIVVGGLALTTIALGGLTIGLIAWKLS